MEMIKVTDIIGTKLEKEDAILLRSYVENFINSGVTLDFSGIRRVPTTFLCCLLTDLINKNGREFVASHLHVKALTNISDYKRVLLGTAFIEDSMMNACIN